MVISFQDKSSVAGDTGTEWKGQRTMMEISREATAEILKNILKHGKFPVMNQNALENAIRYLTPIIPDSYQTNMGVFQNCGECGTMLRSYDKFCSECGFEVKK